VRPFLMVVINKRSHGSPEVPLAVWLLKTPHPLRRLRLRAFFGSLYPCRPSSSRCFTRSGS
jgi:hypothetical protein